MQQVKDINGMSIVFSDETEYLKGIPAVSSASIAVAFGKRHDNVLRDFRDYIDEIHLLKNEATPEEAEKYGVREGIDYCWFDREDEYGRTQKAIAVGERLFYLVALAYRGKAAIEMRAEFVNTFFEMKKTVYEQKVQLLESERKRAIEHSNRSKGQNKRAKDKLKQQVLEQNSLLKQFAEHLVKYGIQ